MAAENLRDVFVNANQTHKVMDRIHLVFAYDEVAFDPPFLHLDPWMRGQIAAAGLSVSSRKPRRAESVLSGVLALPFVKELKAWIRVFLANNAAMVASEIPRNRLVQPTPSLASSPRCQGLGLQIGKVLSLVHSLVNYGYYGDTEDIRKLLEPMLSLMNGRNDRPFPLQPDAATAVALLSSDVREELDKFREEHRFKKTEENDAVTDAKYE